MSRRRVLVVDDEPDLVELVQLILHDREVRTAPNGAAALASIRLSGCDLLVTDVKMPGMSGLVLAEEARRLVPGLPVVILTGHRRIPPPAEDRSGFQWLAKPFRAEALRTAVAAALG